MSKAFLFIALALIVACATAAQFTAVLSAGIPDDCEDLIYAAAGSNFVVGSWADQESWAKDAKNAKCNTAATAGGATITFVKRDDIAAACFTATKPGAAPACGIATGAACTATEFCATDNQCVSAKCEVQPRYVWKFDAVTAAADVPAAIKAIIEAVPSAADKAVFPCKDKAPTVTVVDQTAAPGNGKWFLTAWKDLDSTCQAVLSLVTPATLIPTNVQADTCATCASWVNRFDTGSNYYLCPCKDADVVISQARFKLVEGAKLGAAKDFYKTNDCLVAVNFVVGENSEFVLQAATKTSADCQKEDPDAEKKAEEWKKIATTVTDVDVVKVTSLAADCVSGKTIKCATDEKCASLRCGKGAACKTAADAAVVCAGKCVAAKEGDAEGKCNSASVVGYVVAVVAVVAVIAAFVF